MPPRSFLGLHRYEPVLDGLDLDLTHLTFPFNGRTTLPLAAATRPGWEETTSQSLLALDYFSTPLLVGAGVC